MRCPRCGTENREGRRFCAECAAPLSAACLACGFANEPGEKFCGGCAAPLAGVPPASSLPQPGFRSPGAPTPRHLAEKILASRTALEGERKQVTVLFADLKGSMELLADRDPEEARRLLDPVLERMMDAVHRYEGTVNQVMGDGIMALFGAPVAHEDHAVRACYAALDMQATMRRYGEEVRRAHGITLQVRVGLHSGEVVVRAIGSDLQMDYTAVGQTTHLAARMEQLASPGSILLTAETLRLAEGYVAVKPLGPVPVKGLPAPIEIYEALGAGALRSRMQAAAARGLTRFVGRDREVEQVRDVLARAGAGHGQVVALVGEPGVGKSRLVWEVAHSHRTHGWLTLLAAAVSYGRTTAYLPVVDLLRAYFQIEDRGDLRRVREKVVGRLLTLDETLRPTLAAFLELLDVPVDDAEWRALDPAERRQRTLDAVKRLLVRESHIQPLLVIVEDLHWIDGETQAVLDSLVESLPTTRVCLVVNYRPEYQHGWGSKSYYTQLRLDALPPERAGELLLTLLGDEPGLPPLKRLLIEQTEGNPFFLEESVRTLVETGVLVGDRGAYRPTASVETIRVPATVQAVLAARIDRLPPEDKALLQTASVVGKNVPLALLHAIADRDEAALQGQLAGLQAAEFLYETSLFPDVEYTFKHALTHEVAYGGLVQDRRRATHARIVQAIERLHADRLGEHVEQLAHHALRGELWEPAARYLRQAGAKAVARSANREAVDFFEHALAVLARLPETPGVLSDRLDVYLAIGPALLSLRGAAAPEVEAFYARAEEVCGQIGDVTRLFPTVWGQWYVNYSRGQHRTARTLADRLMDVARTAGESAQLLEAHHALWATLLGTGELAACLEHARQGLVLYDAERDRSAAFLYGGHDPGVCCRNFVGQALWSLGYPDQALDHLREAARLARALSHPLTTATTLFFLAWLHLDRGEPDLAAGKAQACMETATQHGLSLWRLAGSLVSAWAMVDRGQIEEGLAEGLRVLPEVSGWRRNLATCFVAEALLRQGQRARARELLAREIARAEANVVGYRLPDLYRLEGEALAEEDAVRAEARLQSALALARTREERSLELRAATSLGRLLARRGRQGEARRLLAETLGWFTEGFATRDLREAGVLVAGL